MRPQGCPGRDKNTENHTWAHPPGSGTYRFRSHFVAQQIVWPQLALGSGEVECSPPVCPGGAPELLVSNRTADHSHQPPITAFDRRDTEAQRGQLSESFTATQAKATTATLDHRPSHDLRRRICSPPCAHSLNPLLLLQNNAPQNLMAR